MGIVTAAAGVGTWFDVSVGFEELRACGDMAVSTELGTFFAEHALHIGAVSLVALQAVFDCRFVNHSLAPILCNFVVAIKADHRLSLF